MTNIAFIKSIFEETTPGSLWDSLLPKLMRGEVCVKEVEKKE